MSDYHRIVYRPIENLNLVLIRCCAARCRYWDFGLMFEVCGDTYRSLGLWAIMFGKRECDLSRAVRMLSISMSASDTALINWVKATGLATLRSMHRSIHDNEPVMSQASTLHQKTGIAATQSPITTTTAATKSMSSWRAEGIPRPYSYADQLQLIFSNNK